MQKERTKLFNEESHRCSNCVVSEGGGRCAALPQKRKREAVRFFSVTSNAFPKHLGLRPTLYLSCASHHKRSLLATTHHTLGPLAERTQHARTTHKHTTHPAQNCRSGGGCRCFRRRGSPQTHLMLTFIFDAAHFFFFFRTKCVFFFCTMLVTLVGNVIVLQWSALFSSLSRSTLVPATQHTRGFQITMVLFSQLICSTCRKILTFPLGAISCRCRNCQTVNPTVHMEVPCSCCGSLMLAPPNTTLVLCPCCTTVTEIPVDLLPPIPEPVNVDGEDEKSAKTIYVELPAAGPQQGGRAGGRPQQGPILVATKIL